MALDNPYEEDVNAEHPWSWVPDAWTAPSIQQQAQLASPTVPDKVEKDGKKVAKQVGKSPEETANLTDTAKLSPQEEAQIQIDPTGPAQQQQQVEAQAAPPDLGEMPSEFVGQGPPPTLADGPPMSAAQAFGGPPPDASQPPVPMGPEAPGDSQLQSMYGYSQPTHTVGDELASQGATMRPEGTPLEEEKHDVNALTDEQFAEYQAQDNINRANERARLKNEADAKQLADSQKNLVFAQQATQHAAQATQQLQQRATQLAATQVDPRHYQKNLGIGGTIATIIAAAIGGAMSQYTGGRNLALEQINKSIESDIASQKDNIDNQWKGIGSDRTNIGDDLARSQETYRAQETYRVTAYQMAINGIDTKMQDYDQNGTTARSLRETRDTVTSAQQTALAKYQQQTFKNKVDGMKAASEYEEKMAAAEKNRQETLQIQAKMAGAGAGAAVPKIDAYGKVFGSYNEIPDKEKPLAFTLPSGGVMLANNAKSAEQGAALSEAYKAVDVDLNRMQQIAIERNNARSTGGQVWKKWQDTGEHEYEQLIIDVGNTYGTTIHGGRPVPAGTLEEIMHVMPQLKGMMDGGDTAKEIDNFRNDIDSRMSGKFSVITGAPVKVRSDRPKVEPINSNTLSSALKSMPIKGDAGYPSQSLGEFSRGLDALGQHWTQTPTLTDMGGSRNKGMAEEFDSIDSAQHKALAAIGSEISSLQAKKKRTPAEETQLKNNRRALAERQEAIKAVADARHQYGDIEGIAKGEAKDAKLQNEIEDDRLTAGDAP